MSKLRLYGDTSGYIDVAAPATADNSTLDLSTVAKTTGADFNGAVDFTQTGGASNDLVTINRSDAYYGSLLKISSGRTDYSDPMLALETTGYINTTNGSYIRAKNQSSADVFRIDGAGRVTMPYQPSFSSTTKSNLLPSNGTVTGSSLVNIVNTGNHFNTSNGTYTAPVAGVYSIKFCTGVNNTSSNNTLRFHVNGSALQTTYAWSTGTAITLMYATDYYLNANDTVAVVLENGSWAGDGRYSITLIG